MPILPGLFLFWKNRSTHERKKQRRLADLLQKSTVVGVENTPFDLRNF
jgi:hypothetical protein